MRVTSAAEQGAVLAHFWKTADEPLAAIVLYRDLTSLKPGAQPHAERFTASDLGFVSLEQVRGVTAWGNELFALSQGGEIGVGRLDTRGDGSVTQSPLASATALAVGDGVLAISSLNEVAVATRSEGAWQWGPVFPFPETRQGEALAIVGQELFISMHEQLRPSESGAPREWLSAEVVRLSLDGEILARYPTRGNAAPPLLKDGGLLFPELNSHWGTRRAALEWLGPGDDALHSLSSVPVISSTDGRDGAFASALLAADAPGEVLYVANGESGLRRGAWSTEALELTPVEGPWDGPAGARRITSIASVGDVLVVPGADRKLHFLKACLTDPG